MNKKSGFTLVEVLITTTVLLVALGGILSLVTYCYSLVETSRNSSKALNIVQRKLEEIRNTPFDNICALNNTNFTEHDPDPTKVDFNGTILIPVSLQNLKEVKIEISWGQVPPQSYTTTIADESE